MKKYLVRVPAKATGNAFWEAEAETEAQAIEIVKQGRGVFQTEEFEIESLDYTGADATEDEEM